MIEINLLETKKPFQLPEILGVDLNLLNFKLIILALILSYLPSFLFAPKWEEEIQGIQKKVRAEDKTLKRLIRETKGQENFKEQIQEFAKQEKKLEEKLAVVKKIIERRKNPMSIMLYLTKNIPENVWLIKMEIKGDKIILTGKSDSYPSIGNFIKNLQSSVFFDASIRLAKSDTVVEADDTRVEKFVIEGNIQRFD